MSWGSAPRTWTTGEIVTAAMLNAEVRDRMNVLSSALLLPVMQSGQSYGSQGRVTNTGLVVTSGRLLGIPFHVPLTITLASLKLNTSATGNLRLGVYNDNAGVPGSLVAGSASTACASPTTTVTYSQVLTGPALYWIAAIFDNTPTVTGIQTNPLFANGFGHVYRTVAYGALPDPFGAVTYPGVSDVCPNVVATLA
jgi:hypothetical protein